MTAEREVTTWYLEMLAPSELREARRPATEHRIERVVQPTAAFARYSSPSARRWHARAAGSRATAA